MYRRYKRLVGSREDGKLRKIVMCGTLFSVYPLLHVNHSRTIFHSVCDICRLQSLCSDCSDKCQLSELARFEVDLLILD